MASNLLIKNFDNELSGLINQFIRQGVNMSVVVIALEKYLSQAKNLEQLEIEKERKEILAKQEQEKQNMIQKEVIEFINSNPEDVIATKEVAGEPVGDMCNADCTECNSDCNETLDPDWEGK